MAKRKTHEEFVEEMKQLHPNIEVLGKYTTYTTPIKFRCKNCGREWECEARYMLRKKYSCECLERDAQGLYLMNYMKNDSMKRQII